MGIREDSVSLPSTSSAWSGALPAQCADGAARSWKCARARMSFVPSPRVSGKRSGSLPRPIRCLVRPRRGRKRSTSGRRSVHARRAAPGPGGHHRQRQGTDHRRDRPGGAGRRPPQHRVRATVLTGSSLPRTPPSGRHSRPVADQRHPGRRVPAYIAPVRWFRSRPWSGPPRVGTRRWIAQSTDGDRQCLRTRQLVGRSRRLRFRECIPEPGIRERCCARLSSRAALQRVGGRSLLYDRFQCGCAARLAVMVFSATAQAACSAFEVAFTEGLSEVPARTLQMMSR